MSLALSLKKYEDSIEDAALAAGALGVAGVFYAPLDMAGMAAIWAGLFSDIAETSGHEFDESMVKKFVKSLIQSAALYYGGSRVLTLALSFVPGAGMVMGPVVNAGLNYKATKNFGQFVAQQLNSPDFSWGGLERAALRAGTALFGVGLLDDFSETNEVLSASSELSHPDTFQIFE